jgi:hypothetical protein
VSEANRVPSDERVLLLAPTSKDAAMSQQVFIRIGVECAPFQNVHALCEAVAAGAGAVVLTDHAINLPDIGAFTALLKSQPAWSDLPVVVLADRGGDSMLGRKAIELFGNVTVLERPVQMASLASVVRTLIRSRKRQYQIREHLLEREYARDQAERGAAQWQAVIQNITDGLMLADTAGHLLMMNPAALAIHEFASAEEMIAKLADYPRLFEFRDTRGNVLALPDWPISRALGGERFSGYEVQVRRLDTGKTWLGSYGGTAVRDAAGSVRLAVLTLRDITERRQAETALAESEARFRQLAESIPQLAWTAKADGWVFWYNRRWYEYTGTTPQQMEGWGWQAVHDPAVLPEVMARWQHCIATGDPFEMEFPIKGADRRFRWFLTRVSPLRDANGTIRLWFGTNTDIEDQRRMAEERNRLLEAERAARNEAERVSQVKDEFLATLSHELRTPLNAILGWSQILALSKHADDADLSEGLRVIESNARAQTRIIEDLLDMSRIINGKIRLDVQQIDLVPVVEAALETVRPAADAKGIRVLKVLDPLAGQVSGDGNRLQQVAWNLLSNAIKFTPRGGRVQVVLERVNSHVELSVIDTGEGIAPTFLPLVFDRFRQADASTTRRHGGLGLGLAIVKQLVELHGGAIWAKSPGPGQGSTFVVALPLSVIHPEPDPTQQPRRRHPKAAPMTGVNGHVLVVDDEPDARRLVRRLLEDCKATVRTASTAAEALAALRAQPPDVLVSDIGMPGEDGYTLIRSVRALDGAQGRDTPAVALTAYARSEDRIRAIQHGFQMHIAKPVEPTELVTIVAALAGRALAPEKK